METIGMHHSRVDSVHLRLANMFDDYWDSEFPDEEFLVIRTRYELPIVVEEGQSVDCREMLLILLTSINRQLPKHGDLCWDRIKGSVCLRYLQGRGSICSGLGWSWRKEERTWSCSSRPPYRTRCPNRAQFYRNLLRGNAFHHSKSRCP
jgi:hypothetical protein